MDDGNLGSEAPDVLLGPLALEAKGPPHPPVGSMVTGDTVVR
jgi:hypothetical protein